MESSMDNCAKFIDDKIRALDLRLTMGAEPTFTTKEYETKPEWNIGALGEEKLVFAKAIFKKLQTRYANGHSIVLHAKGKWCAGEMKPRWSFDCYWLDDNTPMWQNQNLLIVDKDSAPICNEDTMQKFALALAKKLKLPEKSLIPAYEDAHKKIAYQYLNQKINQSEFTQQISEAESENVGFILPMRESSEAIETEQWAPQDESMVLQEVDMAMCYRIPGWDDTKVSRTALCIELRDTKLSVSMPKLKSLDIYLSVLNAVEAVATQFKTPIFLEGFEPPADARLLFFKITPDPGVLEINMPPAASWNAIKRNNKILFEEAYALGLTTEKYLADGRPIGTGGGHHIVIGGITPTDSPLLRKPHLLRSIITYWQHHPSISYLFSGLCIGSTSQAPRIDESIADNLQELEIELSKAAKIDDLNSLKYLVTDFTGNAHRAEICVDKLLLNDKPAALQGLLEFRAFEMPHTLDMCLTQLLLVRALTVSLWETPYDHPFVRWHDALHDRFLLPHFIMEDFKAVIQRLNSSGYMLALDWFTPFFENRFPLIGKMKLDRLSIELRYALEPWNVVGNEATSALSSRTIDSAIDRIQLKVTGLMPERHTVVCNGMLLPLQATEEKGEYVIGIRFKARELPVTAHPTTPIPKRIEIEVIDREINEPLGGCSYIPAQSEFKIQAPKEIAEIRHPAKDPEHPFTFDLCRPL